MRRTPSGESGQSGTGTAGSIKTSGWVMKWTVAILLTSIGLPADIRTNRKRGHGPLPVARSETEQGFHSLLFTCPEGTKRPTSPSVPRGAVGMQRRLGRWSTDDRDLRGVAGVRSGKPFIGDANTGLRSGEFLLKLVRAC